MACYHPIPAWRTKGGEITFKAGQGVGFEIKVPCGQCIGCRLARARQWAIRCVHESQMHERNSFITLTYDDPHLPRGRTLVKKDFQDFLKRLRKSLPYPIRYYHCGEYGEQYGRPHYHALIFGHDFPDKKPWVQRRGNMSYKSEALDKIWGKGFAEIGDVTFESAAYCARYVVAKQKGSAVKHHYETLDPETGEIIPRLAEYSTMSLRPGIAATWFEKFGSDVFPDDFVIMKGKKHNTPRFYEILYEREQGEEALEAVKNKRAREARKHMENQTPERLAVRETVHLAKAKRLKRELK